MKTEKEKQCRSDARSSEGNPSHKYSENKDCFI